MLKNDRELVNTKEKLQLLEERYAARRSEADNDSILRAAELTSLKRFMNQLIEEIARYEAHRKVKQ